MSGIMKNDAVKSVQVKKIADILLFIGFISNNKEFGIGRRHALKGIIRIQPVKYPAVAIGRCYDTGARRQTDRTTT